MIADLNDLEASIAGGTESPTAVDGEATIARLQRLEPRLTEASRTLLDWRSCEVERAIVGNHLEALIVDYERAGAMTTRLLAMLARRATAA